MDHEYHIDYADSRLPVHPVNEYAELKRGV